jgi:2-methylcitrate dehydratase
MTLALALSGFVQEVRLERLDARVVEQARTLVLDALACMLHGVSSAGADIAMAAVTPLREGAGASVAGRGIRASAADAALANGAMLRSLDLMDVYVSRDVCHPSEIIPTALACAEASGASGKAFLETAIAGLALHQALADQIPLHRHQLHHAGQAAWVVPLVAGRLLGAPAAVAARALTVTAHRLLMPESFARGQLTNLKALAYPLLAREGIEAVRLAQAGLAGRDSACEDMLALLADNFGMAVDADRVVPAAPIDLATITLKMYPAQYALQPLIAAAVQAHAAWKGQPGKLVDQIDEVVVRASQRTVERTADPAKYTPAGPEAADHSLPFAVAVALMDGRFDVTALHSNRWADPATLAFMRKVVATSADATNANSVTDSYQIGQQALMLSFLDGTTAFYDCAYPPPGATSRTIALRKLLETAGRGRLDPDAVLEMVSNVEAAPDLSRLGAAIRGAGKC